MDKISVRGLECDNPKCDWKDDTDDTISTDNCAQWMDKTCPKCGQNLFTDDTKIGILFFFISIDLSRKLMLIESTKNTFNEVIEILKTNKKSKNTKSHKKIK
jgi:hypothetical protein